jgi:hypothetical protein
VVVKTTEELPAALPTVIAWVPSVCAATVPGASMPRMAASTNGAVSLRTRRWMFAPGVSCNLVLFSFGTVFSYFLSELAMAGVRLKSTVVSDRGENQ